MLAGDCASRYAYACAAHDAWMLRRAHSCATWNVYHTRICVRCAEAGIVAYADVNADAYSYSGADTGAVGARLQIYTYPASAFMAIPSVVDNHAACINSVDC